MSLPQHPDSAGLAPLPPTALETGGVLSTAHDRAMATASWGAWRDPQFWLGVVGIAAIGAATIATAARLGAGATLIAVVALGMVALGGVTLATIWSTVARQRATGRTTAAWQAIGDALPFPCCAVARSGRMVYANRAFEAWFPDSRHAPLASVKKRLGGDDAAGDLIGRLAAAAARGLAQREEIAVAATGGGDPGRYAVSAHPAAAGSGLVVWFVEDVTEQRTAEAAAHDALGRLGDFVAHAPVGLYSADADGRLLLVNDVFAGWLGRAPDEIVADGVTLHDVLVTPEPALLPSAAGAAAPCAGVEVGLRGRDGTVTRAIVSQSVATDAAGGGVRSRSVVRELAAAAAAPRSLAGLTFDRFTEEAPVGIVLLDADGRVVESNRVWRRLVAPDASQTAGRLLTDLVAEDEIARVATWIERVVADAELATPIDVMLKTVTEQGTPRVATMMVSRLADAAGGVTGLLVHFLEATEQRNLEAQFAQGQKMQAVGQLAGGVAHDFNNLLTAMIGFCDLLLLRHSPGDQSFADIMQIKQNANRAARLVRQLLAFSRQQTLQPRVLTLTDVLGDLSNLIRRLIGANIQLDMVHGRDLGPVRVDQGQIEQVVINLAVNARDAMVEGGKLTIRTSNRSLAVSERRGGETIPPGDYVVLAVGDSGTGIAPEHLEHIFEPFFTTKEVGAGTGLGLSTVYGIVKQTGGFIFVDSKLGEGTTFTIMLPRHVAEAGAAPAKSEAQADAPASAETTGVGTVLLVEDEDAVRLFSARALRAKGYKVLEARTGEAAMELFGVIDEPVDLMITDAVMPEMDGPTLIVKVRETRPDLPVICISGYAEEAFRKRLGESDDIHFLPKPFSLAQLAGKVKEVMTG